MIETRGINKTFVTKKAIVNLSFTINEGITGLVGENGAGKSTLLRLLADVYCPDSGEIFIDDKKNSDASIKKDLFFLPDDPFCPNGGDIREVFRFYSCFYDLDEDVYYSSIRSFGLPEVGRVSSFSKGMKRQTFLSLCFAMKARYLLLDEAFDGLDPLAMEKVKTALVKKKNEEGCTIVIASHNINALDGVADSFLLLSRGHLGASGRQEDLSANLKKYQALLKEDITKDGLAMYGLRCISIKKVGSITHFIVYENDEGVAKFEQAMKPVLLESIPIDANEILSLSMEVAKEGN